MGRIAKALKRAQRERAQQLDPPPAYGVEISCPDQPSRRTGEEFLPENPPAATPELPSRVSILEAPTPVRPLLLNAPPILPDAVAREVVAFHETASSLCEKYRSVRTRLLTANTGGSTRVYAVTSALPREGKSTTVANLGFALAELRHLRVAMVDLDFRKRGLTTLFHANAQPGISEILRGEKDFAEVCLPAIRDNLCLIPVGDPGSNSPSDLLAGDGVAQVFREIKRRFHYTLVDTPPIHAFADIGLIAPLCHSVLIVIRMKQTPEPLLRRSVKMLQANQIPIAGCILAGCDEDGAFGHESHNYLNGGVA